MRLTFLGSGDAFGSGGRLNTCFLVERGAGSFLIDCGATAMISLRRFAVDPNAIGAILISHLHGDHFGGLPFLLLDARFVSRREAPLVIAGPPGLARRLEAAMEALFPGSWAQARSFPLDLIELEPLQPTRLDEGLTVTGHEVVHPSGAPALGLRVACDGKVIAFTGDTEWTENLIALGRDADLLIGECYSFEQSVPAHLNYALWRRMAPEIGARRLVLTHMSSGMLERLGEVEVETAHDGLAITLD